MDAQLERRLRELLDRDAIWQVMQRYARGLDRLDNELARSCYWGDAIEDHGHFVGTPDDFIQWADGTTLRFASTAHGLLNHSCDLQGDDAYCETYYTFTGLAPEPPHLMSTGRYIDHFQKRDGEWRIANRVCIIETQYELRDYEPSKQMPSAYTADAPCQASRDREDVSYHRPPVPRRPRI
ncbi:nuclear transport factor 2 family protein [Novosphingobium album (ex Liu et al. 2023)]|uniref:Nuclear transport factor 2 family protein n=1 Tax=Novosphingobium album (ex Liu et al. 2023) TaxID=3031130 RepID=A0ABT5WL98_9SPHN|nr:nuclear transport factor 2 family protein [Novosphingobium album (ex Liu et al. 2023)]MDE8650795.1 nuclear transport factor 2 family protein [Novosphingobium album (ex Liu et al. 2023)]